MPISKEKIIQKEKKLCKKEHINKLKKVKINYFQISRKKWKPQNLKKDLIKYNITGVCVCWKFLL